MNAVHSKILRLLEAETFRSDEPCPYNMLEGGGWGCGSVMGNFRDLIFSEVDCNRRREFCNNNTSRERHLPISEHHDPLFIKGQKSEQNEVLTLS